VTLRYSPFRKYVLAQASNWKKSTEFLQPIVGNSLHSNKSNSEHFKKSVVPVNHLNMLHKITCSMALQSLKDLGRLSYGRFLKPFRHLVRLLGRVISPSQCLYLNRTAQLKKTSRNIHVLSVIRTRDPNARPHCHCDRHTKSLS
jgi:hypothetical protein